MNYLKKIAFEDDNIKSSNRSNDSNGNVNTDSSNEGNNKSKKKVNYENEHQIRIGGKLYHLQNEMGLIAKQILSKCKFYNTKTPDKK